MDSIKNIRNSKLNKVDKLIIESNSRLRTLVYYTTVGEKHARLTNISIHTLLTTGGYKGDVLVFGDDYFINYNMHNVKTVRINTEYEYVTCNAKVFCTDFIDPDNYDQIMFLDSDIEVQHNIYPLFRAKDKLMYKKEWHRHSMFPFKHPWASSSFTEEEWELYKDEWIVNSGQFCVDARLFRNFSKLWKDISSRYDFIWGTDQSSLSLIVYKNLIKNESWDRNDPIENKYIVIGGDWDCYTSDKVILHHYHSINKEIMLERYKHLFK